MFWLVMVSVLMGTKVVLWKLMLRPVARVNLSRISLRVFTACEEARAMISVSSAYWRTVGGRSV